MTGRYEVEKITIRNYPMVCPAPTVLVGAEVNGRPNYATAGAFGVVCLEPVFYVSLKSTHYTTGGVREQGVFSINVPSAAMVRVTDYCGTVSGKTTDKSRLFTSFYDDRGKAPMISECPLNFLCRTIHFFPMRGFEVFFGEILATYLDTQCMTDDQPDPLKINPMIMMGTSYFDLGQAVGNVFKEGAEYS